MRYHRHRRVLWILACIRLFFPAVAMGQAAPAQAPAVQAPSITSAAKATFTVGKPGTFTVKANGNPAPTLSQTTLPPDLQLLGLIFDPKTGKLTGAPKQAGTYTIKFEAANSAGTVSQDFIVTVQAAPPAPKLPCDGGTYTVRLRTLQGADADSLAKALNGTFTGFSVIAVPPTASASNGNQTQTASGSSGTGQSQQSTSAPHQILCVYLRDTDPKTGKLKAFVPEKSAQPEQSELESVIQQLDQPEFAGIGLDNRFLVHFANLKNQSVTDQNGVLTNKLSDLVSALPTPAPGLELNSGDLIGQYLVLHPASADLQFATKAGGDLATQAAKVKHDLLALDEQVGLLSTQGPLAQQVQSGLTKLTPSSSSSDFDKAERVLERWDATHTVYLQVMDPRELVLDMADELSPSGYDIQVLAQQRAITIRPKGLDPRRLGLGPQEGVIFASDAIEREAIYEHTRAEKIWEQKLQTDGGSNAKQGSGNSGQQPFTQTNSTTTITTPQASGAAPTKTAPAIQVQTTTSTQSTTPSSAQGGATSANAAQDSGSNSAPAGAGASSGGSSSEVSANTGTSAGSGGTQGKGGGSGSASSAGQAQQASQPSPAGTVVRLFHLRQASNIAAVLNAMAPGPGGTPSVQPLSDYGNDDLLLILPPAAAQIDNTESLRRTIAYLDEPRPTVSLQVWSYEVSSEEGASPDDQKGRIGQARDVSTAYDRFTTAVQHADNKIQGAMAAGMGAALDYAISPGTGARGPFFDDEFASYLTEKFEDCARSDRYCLGYENALTFPKRQQTRDNVTLDRFVVLLAAARDDQAQAVIDRALQAMNDEGCQYTSREGIPLCFDDFSSALTTLALPRNLHQFRAAVLDFLYQYKVATMYPNDFAPYYLERSAQNLDGYLNSLIAALDRDLDHYLHARLEEEARSITEQLHRRIGLANYGEVQVASISGDAANVSGVVNNYFDVTPPALLKDVLSGLLGGAGGGGNGQSSGSGASSGSASGGSTGSGSSSGGSSTTGTGSSSSGAGAALASAAKLLTPWQAVALNALATASAPPQLMAQINAQTTLAVTPISLDTASAAELNLSLQVSNPTTTVDASKGAPSSFIRQDLANSVASYSVQTKVRVDSLKLFPVSSLSMDLTHPQSPVPVPIIGWAWDAVFGGVPVMKDMFAFPRGPKTIQNRSIAVVRAVIVPTAMDLGLSIPFRDDRITDPVTGTSKSFSSWAQTSNKFQEFHLRTMHCILEGRDDCMISVRLSGVPEQTY